MSSEASIDNELRQPSARNDDKQNTIRPPTLFPERFQNPFGEHIRSQLRTHKQERDPMLPMPDVLCRRNRSQGRRRDSARQRLCRTLPPEGLNLVHLPGRSECSAYAPTATLSARAASWEPLSNRSEIATPRAVPFRRPTLESRPAEHLASAWCASA